MATRSILFLSKGHDAPSTRYRAVAYFPLLREAGWVPSHMTTHRGGFARLRLLRAAARADVVVVLRKTFTAGFGRLLRRAAKRLIYDFDDAVFVRDSGQPSATRMRRFRQTVRLCDQVWAGNRYLAEACAALNPTVTILPTPVDPVRYDADAQKPPGTFDVVWIGSSSTGKYVAEVLPALERAAMQVAHLRLKLIADFDLPTQNLTTVTVPWTEQTEAAQLAASHVGIAPLPDDPWTRGKCGLKVLHYMAAGLAVIASAVGVHQDIVVNGQTGYLAQ
ncbi:MAG: glycosyltransferase, partial [Phycisphaeraceae bacterium]